MGAEKGGLGHGQKCRERVTKNCDRDLSPRVKKPSGTGRGKRQKKKKHTQAKVRANESGEG